LAQAIPARDFCCFCFARSACRSALLFPSCILGSNQPQLVKMFNPDMMSAAQNMMANMKPEDMKKMSDWASNVDPKTMENMMKSMGQSTNGMDTSKMSEQMKNMTPEQMKSGMSQMQSTMAGQKKYMYDGAVKIKNDGNSLIKEEKYIEALENYSRALENLAPHNSDEIDQLKQQLLNNSAMCHLKLKDFDQTISSCDKALAVDPRSFKAYFRRGQAQCEKGQLQEAVADVRRASELAPSDKAISAELSRLRAELKSSGIKEIEGTPLPPAARAPSASSGGSSSSSANVSQTVDQLAKNPELLQQASEAMKNLSPDELNKMMSQAPLPPGMTPEMMKSQMETLSKNPDMIKSAVSSLQSLPEEERKKLLSQRASMQGGQAAGSIPGGFPAGDMSQMSKVLENPEMIQQAVEMTKNMKEEDLAKLNLGNGEADMMRQAAEQMAANPDLAQQMSDMMKNMPPDQMAKMMEMSSQMRGGGMGGNPMAGGVDGDESAGMGGMGGMANMMSDPGMMKAAEEMMKNMPPETMAAMARSSGLDLDDDKARMVSKFLPWLMMLMRWFSYVRKAWTVAFSRRGRIVLAVVVLLIAMIQHYR